MHIHVLVKFMNACLFITCFIVAPNMLQPRTELKGTSPPSSTSHSIGLGSTVCEIDITSAQVFSKTIFSMVIPEVEEVMSAEPERNAVVLFGIETQVEYCHICVSSLKPLCAQYSVTPVNCNYICFPK